MTVLCIAVCGLFCISVHGQDQASISSLEKLTAYVLKPDNQKVAPTSTIQMLAGEPIYQINAGGWEAPAGWERDTKDHPSPYVTAPYFKSQPGIDWLSFYMEKSRIGNSQWDFPVANGDYVVTLHFVEYNYLDIGERVFDVDIEGNKALVDFDIAYFTGQEFPVSLSFSVNVTDNNLDIDFTDHAWGRALISAIVVRPVLPTNLDPILYQSSRTLVKSMKEGAELRIPIRATDFDSPASAIKLYGGTIEDSPYYFARVIDHGDGSGELLIRPDYDDAGQYLLIIAAEDEDGIDTACDACWALVELTVEDTPEGSSLYRVNVGDWKEVEDSPVNWSIDSYGNPSPFLSSGITGFQSHNILSNSTDAPDNVLRQSRVLLGGYNMLWEFPVSTGYYTVNLYFVESHFDAANMRVFDVRVGRSQINDLDIFAEAGKNVPLKKSVTTRAYEYEGLEISLNKKRNTANPLIAAIDIIYEGKTAPTSVMEVMVDASEANHDLDRKVSVYPNPIDDKMTFTFPDQVKGPIAIRLIDRNNSTSYKAVNESDEARTEATFHIDAKLPSGVYLAEVIAGNSREYIQILKR
ncbi:hypothetical protein C900_00400 [Fulvivirga imtechensis AK7]|uniref:Malectin domain-containing protein n=2 Tax=Fulvivirga TaxID=396811 RepID=L8JM15_9BACT|nr:hypothetical protein C900_00400 [Fulvivirga imtechensis AK7]